MPHTLAIQAMASTIVDDPAVQTKLLEQAKEGTLAPPLMQMLFYYAHGKPTETIKLGEDRDNPFLSATERQQRLAELTAKAEVYVVDSRRRA